MAGRGVALQRAKALKINLLFAGAHFQGDLKPNSMGPGPNRLLLLHLEIQLRCLVNFFFQQRTEEEGNMRADGWAIPFKYLNSFLLQ